MKIHGLGAVPGAKPTSVHARRCRTDEPVTATSEGEARSTDTAARVISSPFVSKLCTCSGLSSSSEFVKRARRHAAAGLQGLAGYRQQKRTRRFR